LGRTLNKIPHPPWRSKRGIFVLFLLIAGMGAVVGAGGMTAVEYSETPGFCGLCHTMDPELKAYAMSPHKEVTCAECHINPGLAGFAKAKINGTKQLLHIITGEYPTPILPPDHEELPSAKDTCLKCHELENITENGGPMKLILKPKFQPDKANTQELVAIMLRPGGLGQAGGVRGVHWHVEQEVTYTSSDIRSRKIDLVEFKSEDGTQKQYIAGTQVGTSADVKPDINRLKASEHDRRMDCTDCHNRVGHAVPSPDQAVDEAIADGRISPALPYIKRDSVALLNGSYPSTEAANKAIDGLRATYAAKYPLVAKSQGKQVTAAIDELKTQYQLIATPAMKVQAKTYPDNLGHKTSPGCFRCHDGAHFLVVKGRVTNETIPSTCATCHTFPQIDANASSFPTGAKPVTFPLMAKPGGVPLGAKPADHKDKLYVFNHKNATRSLTSAGTSCGACHAPSYCLNCHKSGAVKVKHDQMLYKHVDAISAAGGTQACAYCHQRPFCALCHQSPVLPPAALQTGPLPPASKGRRAP